MNNAMPGSDALRIWGDFKKKKKQLVEIWSKTKLVDFWDQSIRVYEMHRTLLGQME